jgi:hypothetical protein
MAQVVEHLPSEQKLNSKPSTTKKKKTNNKIWHRHTMENIAGSIPEHFNNVNTAIKIHNHLKKSTCQ